MFTVRVEKTAELGIDYDWCVGISTTGYVITEDRPCSLCKFSLQEHGSYIEQWRRQLPENIRSAPKKHTKCLTETGVILQDREENSTTFLFNQDMELKDSWQHKGELIGCLPGPRTVYAVREPKRHLVEYLVEIKSQNGELIQLKPDRKPWNRRLMSVCEDGRTGKLVVVQHDWHDSSMDIFSGVGKTKHRIHHQIIMQVQIFRESS